MVYPLDDLLDSLGFLPINIYIYGIIIPVIALIGLVLGILVVFIFFKKKFSASIYWYFRVISIANLIQLAFAIPYGICFTPTYIPSMDSYACALVQSAYIPYENFTSHFRAILEIAILLERIKIMNPFVKKHFTISPQKMILITLFPCLLFNAVYALVYVPYNGGDFYYFDSSGIQRVNSFWFVSESDLAGSPIGVYVSIGFYFVRDVLTLITTLTLNVVSMFEMSKYFKKRNVLLRRQNLVHPLSTISPIDSTSIVNTHIVRERALTRNHVELVVTMCFISIAERVTTILCDVFYLFAADYVAILFGSIVDLVLVVGPSISFFVFFHFNRDFRGEFFSIISGLHLAFGQLIRPFTVK